MIAAVKTAVAAVLAVPAEPEAPFGAAGALRVFRASRGYLRYKLAAWLGRQVGFISGLLFLLLATRGYLPDVLQRLGPISQLIRLLEMNAMFFSIADTLVLAVFLAQLPFSWLLVVLDYEYRWYMITDRSLRIREGIWRVREQTMTFSNIQNVEIRRGPIQRIFGIADLEVRTAGGGSAKRDASRDGADAGNLHVGYFRGLDDPSAVRAVIMERLREARGTGLGDPDDDAAGAADSGLFTASQELLAEARALRAWVEGGAAVRER